MKILAIDAATEACSVALLINNEVVERFAVEPRRHTELVLPMVDELLAEAGINLKQLDCLAFDRGPGSFTGVRVGTSVIQGLAFSAQLPVVAISSLQTLAHAAWRTQQQQQILSLIDARMGEVYWAVYRYTDQQLQLLGEEQVSPVAGISLPDENYHACGSGWDSYQQELTGQCGVKITSFEAGCFPHAQDVVILAVSHFQQGRTVSAEQALPVYIRDEVTWKKLGQQ